jgi:putative intracellular protease/amidase
MKKVLIILLALICGGVGLLAYDWHVKTSIQEDDQRVTLYSWTDEKGAKHFTNTQPPDGAKNIEESKGYKYVDQPLVVKIKNKTIEGYKWIKEKLFKKKDRKKKGGNRSGVQRFWVQGSAPPPA